MTTPTDADKRKAEEVMIRLRRTFYEPSDLLYASMEFAIATALAAEREAERARCEADRADGEIINSWKQSRP